jgi:hypothetical protein
MARSYGDKLLAALDGISDSKLGHQLALTCIKANVPAARVAKVLKVSKVTVHKWFRGMGVRESNYKAVEQLIARLRIDLDNGTLPITSLYASKAYFRKLEDTGI